jgi:hypothetical protein
MHNFFSGKNSSKILMTPVIFRKLPKGNNRPIGEDSPNLVTLVLGQLWLAALLHLWMGRHFKDYFRAKIKGKDWL